MVYKELNLQLDESNDCRKPFMIFNRMQPLVTPRW